MAKNKDLSPLAALVIIITIVAGVAIVWPYFSGAGTFSSSDGVKVEFHRTPPLNTVYNILPKDTTEISCEQPFTVKVLSRSFRSRLADIFVNGNQVDQVRLVFPWTEISLDPNSLPPPTDPEGGPQTDAGYLIELRDTSTGALIDTIFLQPDCHIPIVNTVTLIWPPPKGKIILNPICPKSDSSTTPPYDFPLVPVTAAIPPRFHGEPIDIKILDRDCAADTPVTLASASLPQIETEIVQMQLVGTTSSYPSTTIDSFFDIFVEIKIDGTRELCEPVRVIDGPSVLEAPLVDGNGPIDLSSSTLNENGCPAGTEPFGGGGGLPTGGGGGLPT